MSPIRAVLSKICGASVASNRPRERDSGLGFHGDQYLLNLTAVLLERSDLFVETGTNVGQTAKYVADRHQNIRVLSCEPDGESFAQAVDRLGAYDRVELHNERSQEFLPRALERDFEAATFFLDAHGDGFEWPLRLEIDLLTAKLSEAVILIDDFRVPGKSRFSYDAYDGQECSLAYVREALDDGNEYTLIYPDYEVRTSTHHPLRGYGLLLMNRGPELVPDQLLENFRVVDSPV